MYEHNKSIHHSFDVNEAAQYGVEEAILIHHFRHWIAINMRLKRNFHEGTYWTYQTLDEISAHFPYMTKDRVFDLIGKLCTGVSRFSKGKKIYEPVLKKGNFNKSRYDRTVWYAFCENTKCILGKPEMEIVETRYEDRGNTTPIPDPIPYPKTNNSPQTREREVSEDVKEKKSYGAHVKLYDEEYQELVTIYGENNLLKEISVMNDHISAHGKKPYKNWPAALRNWFVKSSQFESQNARRNEKCKKTSTQSKSTSYKPGSSGKDTSELILVPFDLESLK